MKKQTSIKTYNYIPTLFKDSKCWVLWKLESDAKGRQTKVPYSALHDGRASSTDPASWSDLDTAVEKYKSGSFSGLGIVLSESAGLVFIDLDHCILDDGSITETASEILSLFNGKTYCELSQSGTGIHIVALGQIPKSFKNSKADVEMYAKGRYMALTGKAISPCEPAQMQPEIDIVFNRYKPSEAPNKPISAPAHIIELSDRDIIKKAMESENGAKFSDLYQGKWQLYYGSQSEADLGFCMMLAFWCQGDPGRMDSVFRSSGLMRPKWNERRGGSTYGADTISKALASCTEYYTPRKGDVPADADSSQEKKKAPDVQLPKFISARALQEAELPPIYYAVENLIPEGLTVLGAPIKTGKSWMMLDMCMRIANGEDFLGFQTNQSGVIYLALESTDVAEQDRINQVLKDAKAPENLQITFGGINQLDSGFYDQLDLILAAMPDTKVIVIDTLGKISPVLKQNAQTYQRDYKQAGALKEYADSHGIAIVCVTHTTKYQYDDVFSNITGSNGLIGAADGIIVIKKKREESDGTLFVTGRKVPEAVLKIRFNKDNLRWQCIGKEEAEAGEVLKLQRLTDDYLSSSVREGVVAIFNKYGKFSGSAKQIIDKAGELGVGIALPPMETGGFLHSMAGYFIKHDGIRVRPVNNGHGTKLWKIEAARTQAEGFDPCEPDEENIFN